MISFPDLQAKWNSIGNSGENYLLISGDHPLSFHIGYNKLKQKSFVIYNTGVINEPPTSKSISAVCIKSELGIYSLQISLQYPALSDVFMLLCWDLMDNSAIADTAMNSLLSRYAKWQKLLQKSSSNLLPAFQIKGLIGELLYLSKCIDELGAECAILGWLGPEGADQDFVFANNWVEVKTTTIASNEVSISSLQQLDRSEFGFLAVYFMDKSSINDSTAISLLSITQDVEDKIKSQKLKDKFWCKLAQRGCFKYQIDRYEEPKYRISEDRLYKVDANFPKLTRKNVPVEILSTQYSISLASIEKYRA